MTIYTQGRTRGLTLLEDMPVSTSAVIDAYTDDPTISPLEQLKRYKQRTIAQEGEYVIDRNPDTMFGGGMDFDSTFVPPKTSVLSIEDQGKIISDSQVPIEPKEGMRQEVLEMLIQGKKEEIARQSATSRASGWQSTAGFLSAVGVSAMDPINLLSAFVPVVGPARYAAMLAKAGTPLSRLGIRAGVGAIEGTAGAMMIEPLTYSLARDEQADYTLADSFINVTMGTVLGGGLHVGFGAIGDAISRGSSTITPNTPNGRIVDTLDQGTKSDLLRVLISAEVDGKHVPTSLPDLIDMVGGYKGIAKTSTALDTVKSFDGVPQSLDVKVKLKDNPPASDILRSVEIENKGLFDELQLVSQKINNITDHYSQIRTQTNNAKDLVSKLDDLQSQLKTADKRKTPRVIRNIDKVKAELKDLGFSTDIPKAKIELSKLEKKSVSADNQLPGLQRTERQLKMKTDRLINNALQRPTTGVPKRVADIFVVENTRGYNGDQIKRVDDVTKVDSVYRLDTVDKASQSLQQEIDSLNEVAVDLGINSDIPADLLRAADDIEVYSKAINALANCGLRIG